MSPGLVVGAALLVAVAATVQTMTGFGFALMAVPVLSLVVPPESAVVLSASLGLLTSTGQAVSERHHGDRPTIRRMVLGGLVGAPLGLAVLLVVSERQLRILLVAVIAVFLVVNVRGIRLRRAGPGVDLGAGAVSGALNTALATNGPPLVMALHVRHLAPPVFRGTLSAVLALQGALTVALFALTGRYDRDVVVLFLASLPGLALGFAVGVRHRRRIAPDRFRGLVVVLLAVTGVVALVGLVVG
ncbi:MAG: sulfite exporter TauE/SafE family protein [Acidimicrobiales bacterium]|jgi:uncharacterized membrane protein YfcA|nr:sulfite exporter TauE/SafE family protein [Acidimicrobiales bacterium]